MIPFPPICLFFLSCFWSFTEVWGLLTCLFFTVIYRLATHQFSSTAGPGRHRDLVQKERPVHYHSRVCCWSVLLGSSSFSRLAAGNRSGACRQHCTSSASLVTYQQHLLHTHTLHIPSCFCNPRLDTSPLVVGAEVSGVDGTARFSFVLGTARRCEFCCFGLWRVALVAALFWFGSITLYRTTRFAKWAGWLASNPPLERRELTSFS